MMNYYWTKIRHDSKMAADLKAMHASKRIPREVSVYGEPDEEGKRRPTGTRIEYDDARIPRRERHRFAMTGGSRR